MKTVESRNRYEELPKKGFFYEKDFADSCHFEEGFIYITKCYIKQFVLLYYTIVKLGYCVIIRRQISLYWNLIITQNCRPRQ